MENETVYIVANIEISDRDRYREYEEGFTPILLRHDGQIIAVDEKSTSLEGEPLHGRIVIARFPSSDHATAWFNDPDYQAIAEHRRAASTAQFVSLVDSFRPPA